jgi:hypothetical protein
VDGPLIPLTWSRVASALAASESLVQALTRLPTDITQCMLSCLSSQVTEITWGGSLQALYMRYLWEKTESQRPALPQCNTARSDIHSLSPASRLFTCCSLTNNPAHYCTTPHSKNNLTPSISLPSNHLILEDNVSKKGSWYMMLWSVLCVVFWWPRGL